MTRHLWIVLALLGASAGRSAAEEPLSWLPVDGKPHVKLHAAGTLAAGAVIEVNGGSQRTSTTVLELKDVKVPSYQYVLSGRIKYDGVEGVGYVEMLNTFPGRGTYFTKTLADSGTMASLTGASDWRDVELPFMSEPGLLPNKIVVSVVLPGKGRVYLAPLAMSAYTGPRAEPGAWWDERHGGLIGGGLGAGIGILGGIVGTAAGLGLGRRWVIPLCWAMIAVGSACLLAGLVALVLRQPFYVSYPLLLIGVICPCVIGFNLRTIRRRYDEHELRRMAAQDA